MPVRRLSSASSTARPSSASETAISTVRLLVSAGESPAGALGSSTTISSLDGLNARPGLVRYEAGFRHQPLVQSIVFFQELQHLLASKEDRLERLLFHVILEFRRFADFLEQRHVERRLIASHFSGQEHGAQHQVLHVDSLLSTGRNIAPGHLSCDLALVLDALLVENAERSYLAGAPDFQVLRGVVDVRLRMVADELRRGLASGLIGQVAELRS